MTNPFIPRAEWNKLTPEERAAIPLEVRQETRRLIQAYNEKRRSKRERRAVAEWYTAEIEAREEYEARERAAKLARALSRIKARKK